MVMYPVFVIESDPPAFLTTNFTLYAPGVLQTTEGLLDVDDEGVPPVNVHFQDVGEFVELSQK